MRNPAESRSAANERTSVNKSILIRVTLLSGLVLGLLLALTAGASAADRGTGAQRWATHEIDADEIARADDDYVVSFARPGTVPSCIGTDHPYTRGDGLFLENHGPLAPCWAPWFSATNSGLPANTNINALHDECGVTDPFCDIFLSFQNNLNVPGVGNVKPQDIVTAWWVPFTVDTYDTWQMVFDGSDVSLTTTGEAIDALYIFDPGEEPADLGCTALLLISTTGNYRVPDYWGNNLTGGGEDVLGFCGYWFGSDTAGYWFKYHDGDAEGAPANSLIGLSHEDGHLAYARFEFLTKGAFHVDGANGGHSEVYHFFQGEYDGPTFSFPAEAWTTTKVDSFHVYHTD